MSTRTLLSTALLLLTASCGLLGASRAERPKIPPHFEPNRGQASSEVSFVSHGEGFGVSIEPTRVAVRLKSANSDPSTISWRLVGASETATLKGLARLPGVSSYFKGSEPKSWVRGVPHYAVIRSAEVYTSIDLVYRGSAQQALEYDFIVAPGADPGEITLEFDSTEVSIDDNGDLVMRTENGELRQRRPELFQEIGGVRRPVQGAFVLLARNRVGFSVGQYERGETLVIDPVLEYSTYLGGSHSDSVRAIAVDGDGNTYVGGRTDSFNFPETTRIGGRGNGDAFVSKINAAGDAIVYSAVIGGAVDDAANAIAVNDAGEVFLTGFTRSLAFPTTPGAFQDFYSGGNSDVFAAKLSPDGTTLGYSTYVGGWVGGWVGYLLRQRNRHRQWRQRIHHRRHHVVQLSDNVRCLPADSGRLRSRHHRNEGKPDGHRTGLLHLPYQQLRR